MEHFMRTRERAPKTNNALSGIPNSKVFRGSPTGLSPSNKPSVSSSTFLRDGKQIGGRHARRKQKGRSRYEGPKTIKKFQTMPKPYMTSV